jgi:hypothetical protein
VNGRQRGAAVAAAACVAFAATLAWRVLSFPGFNNDHYVHLARAQQLLLGDLPIRDFVDPGMPLMYLLSAAAWRLWGGTQGTELLLVSAAFALGAALTVVVVYRLTGSMLLAFGAATLEVVIAPRTYSYPKVLLYAAAAVAIVAISAAPSRSRIALAGVLAGVAFLFRHDHGLYIGIGALAAVTFAHLGERRRLVAGVVLLACSALVIALPWLAYVEYYQGLASYLQSGLAFSRAEAANSTMDRLPRFDVSRSEGLVRLRPPQRPSAIVEWKADTPAAVRHELERKYLLEPVPSSDNPPREYFSDNRSPAALRQLAGDPHVHDVSGLDRFVEWTEWDAFKARLSPDRIEIGSGWHVTPNAYVWLFYLFHLLPIVCGVVVWRRWRRGRNRWPGESAAVGALALMTLVANLGLIRGNLPVWLPDAVVCAVLLGAWLLSVAWVAPRRGFTRVAARTALVVLVALSSVAVAAAGDLHSQVDRAGVATGVDGVRARVRALDHRLWGRQRDAGMSPSGVSDALAPFYGYLDRCSARTDRLMMTRLYPDVFVLAERGFAGGHVAFLEGFYASPEEQRATLARMRHESVPFVLMVAEREDAFRRSFPLLGAHLDADYQPMTDIPLEDTDAVRVLVEKKRVSSHRDAQTGWPCLT